jgi:hypothetical protein
MPPKRRAIRVPKVFAVMQYDQISEPLLPKIRNFAQVKSSLLAAISLPEENVRNDGFLQFNYTINGTNGD